MRSLNILCTRGLANYNSSLLVLAIPTSMCWVILQWNGALLSLFLSFPSVLWPRDDDVEHNDNDEHDDKHRDDHNDCHPPHPGDPVYGLLDSNRVKKEVSQSV